ncbi:M20 family metallopeptidase [Streptomyces roseofulvus]|uniref:M20 family metallopeptidase n=1 Tax=Streptomyces roseofulvus TaxID=33902 RepID=UPI0031FBBD2E
MTDALRSDSEELVALLQELVRCHPVYGTPGQQAVMDVAERHLRETGLAVRRFEVDHEALRRSEHYVDVTAFGGEFTTYGDVPRDAVSAWADFPADGPHVVLNGHVDVEFVTSPYSWDRPGLWSSGLAADGRVYGRGTCDMLGGVACYLYVLRKMAPLFDRARGAVTVQIVLDEEIGGNGTLAQLLEPRGKPVDVALIAEPSDLTVCEQTRGFHQFAIHYTGEPVHMVFAQPFDNANRALPALIGALEELDAWVADQAGSRTARRYVMYGDVRGGSDAAVPAESVELRVTLALPPQVGVDEVMRRLADDLARLSQSWPRSPRIRDYGLRFPGSELSDEPLVEELLAAGRRHGMLLLRDEFPSACDARLFEAFGIPSVVFGPGSLRRAHSSDEWVDVSELVDYCVVLAEALMKTWGVTS